MTYQQSPAHRSARLVDRSDHQYPYHVSLYADWSDDGLTVGFQTEEEARSFAASRPEPLIDLVKRDHGVIAQRRMVAHPTWAGTGRSRVFRAIDAFPQIGG